MAPNVGANKAFKAIVSATRVRMSDGQSERLPHRGSDTCFPARPTTFSSLHKRQRALPSKPDDPMTEAVKHDVELVIRAWRKYRSTRIRDAVYELLQQVYETGLKWKRADHFRKMPVGAPADRKSPPMYPETFAVLLVCAGVCAGPNDAKTRNGCLES